MKQRGANDEDLVEKLQSLQQRRRKKRKRRRNDDERTKAIMMMMLDESVQSGDQMRLL